MAAATKKQEYEYDFGCDGLVAFSVAAERLGVSVDTLERYAHKGYVRAGVHKGNKHRGRRMVCVRSMRDYLASIEN